MVRVHEAAVRFESPRIDRGVSDGSFGLAWFSGKGEGLNRCSIVFATLPNGTDTWTDAITVSVHDGYSDQNPVLY